MVGRALSVGGCALLVLAGAVRAAGTSGDAVVEYVAGAGAGTSLEKSAAATLGLPASVDDGQTSPFTPPFHASSITIVGAGGDLILHFAQPVLPTPGLDIGVFTNTGLAGQSAGGVVTATGGTLGMHDTAIVSVSTNNAGDWVTLNGGNPIDLTMPSNAFVDGTLSATGASVTGGTIGSNPYQPFAGSLSNFTGLTYPQMVTLFNGSFGGAWIDASASGLSAINYIRFDVPTGDRLVLDAVTAANAVPEPGMLGLLAAGSSLLLLRRR